MPIPSKDFNTVENMLDYMRIHRETPRALVSIKHIAQLLYLSGYDISHLCSDVILNNFFSLHGIELDEYIQLIHEKIEKCTIPNDWEESFEKLFMKKTNS